MKKKILVTGDVIIDHHIYQGGRATPGSHEPQGTLIVESMGGALLLYDIIARVSELAEERLKNSSGKSCTP